MTNTGKIGNSLHYPKNATTKKKYDSFCREYHINGNNATQAAIHAGYSKKTAGAKATFLLKIVYIQDENGEYVAVNITTNSYEIKKTVNDKLINYTISFEYAQTNTNQRG